MEEDHQNVTIYTFGMHIGTRGHGRIGAYTFGVVGSDPTKWTLKTTTASSNDKGRITNQLMELAAVSDSMRAIDRLAFGEAGTFTIMTTSSHVMNCMSKWLPRWRKTGWITKQHRTVQNVEMLKQMAEIADRRAVSFTKVDLACDENMQSIQSHVQARLESAVHAGCTKRYGVTCDI